MRHDEVSIGCMTIFDKTSGFSVAVALRTGSRLMLVALQAMKLWQLQTRTCKHVFEGHLDDDSQAYGSARRQ